MHQAPILNLAGYLFTELHDLPALRAHLQAAGSRLDLRGTVLLAPEGINLFAAAPEPAVREFLALVRADPRLAPLTVKESLSDAPPFRRFRVRIKKEIITLRHPALRPAAGRAPAVDARTLKRWLDQGHDDTGRPLLLLDTRNRYEIEAGTFEGAHDPRIRHFTEFPAALDHLPPSARQSTIVTFCTGGIRCEKAALHMLDRGFGNVLQLDGGILKYFEDVGGAHYHGRCFVFDNRLSLDPALTPEAPAGIMRQGPDWQPVHAS